MKLIRVSVKGKIFHVKDCRGLAALRGLMFDSSHDGALIRALPGAKRLSVWMPFVRHTLFLFFLDEKYRVLKTTLARPMTLHPSTWKLYSCEAACCCLEIRSDRMQQWQSGKS